MRSSSSAGDVVWCAPMAVVPMSALAAVASPAAAASAGVVDPLALASLPSSSSFSSSSSSGPSLPSPSITPGAKLAGNSTGPVPEASFSAEAAAAEEELGVGDGDEAYASRTDSTHRDSRFAPGKSHTCERPTCSGSLRAEAAETAAGFAESSVGVIVVTAAADGGGGSDDALDESLADFMVSWIPTGGTGTRSSSCHFLLNFAASSSAP